jgi:mannose-1-phosphate guanylyltransferase
MDSTHNARDLWSIILAGGNGERLKPMVQRWLGRHKPKQYCTFIGTRSMFQHTLDRSDRIIAQERRVTVIARDHWDDAWPQLASRRQGKVILQPSNRETAAGIFLGLSYVRAHDPQATVLIFPSDHFVYPEDAFVEMAPSLARAAKNLKHWIFLLGASPDSPEPEYSWIQPGAHLGWMPRSRYGGISRETEPGRMQRGRASRGPLEHHGDCRESGDPVEPGLALLSRDDAPVRSLVDSIGGPREEQVLEGIYQVMPSRNFSAHLLQEFPKHVAVMELRDVIWSDWGKPERIVETLRQIGREPVFCRAHFA